MTGESFSTALRSSFCFTADSFSAEKKKALKELTRRESAFHRVCPGTCFHTEAEGRDHKHTEEVVQMAPSYALSLWISASLYTAA